MMIQKQAGPNFKELLKQKMLLTTVLCLAKKIVGHQCPTNFNIHGMLAGNLFLLRQSLAYLSIYLYAYRVYEIWPWD